VPPWSVRALARVARGDAGQVEQPTRPAAVAVTTGLLGLGEHLYAPVHAIGEFRGDRLVLAVRHADLAHHDWRHRPAYLDAPPPTAAPILSAGRGWRRAGAKSARPIRIVQEVRQLTELKKRGDYLCTLAEAPSWEEKFGDEIGAIRRAAKEEDQTTTNHANKVAKKHRWDAAYHPWGGGP
jgi:hypothetical protein